MNSLCLYLLGLTAAAGGMLRRRCTSLPRLKSPLINCLSFSLKLLAAWLLDNGSTALLDRDAASVVLFLLTTRCASCESGSSKMLVTLHRAFLGLAANNNRRWDDLVVGKFPPEATDSLLKLPLFVGGGFSRNLSLVSRHRENASLFSFIHFFHVFETLN